MACFIHLLALSFLNKFASLPTAHTAVLATFALVPSTGHNCPFCRVRSLPLNNLYPNISLFPHVRGSNAKYLSKIRNTPARTHTWRIGSHSLSAIHQDHNGRLTGRLPYQRIMSSLKYLPFPILSCFSEKKSKISNLKIEFFVSQNANISKMVRNR